MLRHLPQPLHPGVLVGRIGLAGSDIDLARDGLVDDGLLLLLQQLDQPFLGADVALYAPVGVAEEADDGRLLGKGREGHDQAPEFARVNVHHRNAFPHASLLASCVPIVRAPTHELSIKVDGRSKHDHVAAANRRAPDEIDRRLPDFLQSLAGPSEQHVAVADRCVVARAVRWNTGVARRNVKPVSGVEVAITDARHPVLGVVRLGPSVSLEESTESSQPSHIPMRRHLSEPLDNRGSTYRVAVDAHTLALGLVNHLQSGRVRASFLAVDIPHCSSD